jgi:hypothetical protein
VRPHKPAETHPTFAQKNVCNRRGRAHGTGARTAVRPYGVAREGVS